MKKVLSIIIILFPYLLGLLAYGLLKEISLDGGNWLIYLILISVLVMVFLIIYIMMLFSMFFKWDIKTSILSNLLIKIAYIPVYCILFLFSALMGNPFTFFLMPIPLMISFIFMVITGIISTILFIRLFINKKKKIKLSLVIVYSILSYCYIIDVIFFIILYAKVKKNQLNLIN